jgi:hypothetical protein
MRTGAGRCEETKASEKRTKGSTERSGTGELAKHARISISRKAVFRLAVNCNVERSLPRMPGEKKSQRELAF